MRWAAAWLGRAVLLSVGLLIGCEIALQLASLFAPERISGSREGAQVRILCVGDSHTWGAHVERHESYPGQLQRLLDERRAGYYHVLNRGLPGMNTTQVRNRLPSWLERYEPDYLILWAGVNNSWNSSEMSFEDGGLLASLDAEMLRSRVYRFLRTNVHNLALRRAGEDAAKRRGYQRKDPLLDSVVDERRHQLLRRLREFRGEREPEQRWHDKMEEELGEVSNQSRDYRPRRAWKRVEGDLAAAAAIAESMGVRLLLIGYPLDYGPYARANEAIYAASDRLSLDTVNGAEVLEQIPPEEREWRRTLHPGPRIYREVATALADRIAPSVHRKNKPRIR